MSRYLIRYARILVTKRSFAEVPKAARKLGKEIVKATKETYNGTTTKAKRTTKDATTKTKKAAKKVKKAVKKVVKKTKKPKVVKPKRPVPAFKKPKRALNAYTLFVKERALALKRENPSLIGTDLFKAVSAEWRSLPESDKQRYANQSAQAAATQQSELSQYLSQRGPDELAYEKYIRARNLKKGKRSARVLRNPDEPTKLIGYNRFVIDQYASARAENDNNSGGNADVMKIIGTRWKALSDAEKKAY